MTVLVMLGADAIVACECALLHGGVGCFCLDGMPASPPSAAFRLGGARAFDGPPAPVYTSTAPHLALLLSEGLAQPYRGCNRPLATLSSDLQPPEPAVAAGAIQFIRVRALGLIPALLGYVAVGVLRGHKDTSTPLYASILSAFVSLALNALFLYGEWMLSLQVVRNSRQEGRAG